MAYYIPQKEEAGIDKFLRRLGSVAGIAQAGANVYNLPLERRMKQLEYDRLKAETEAYPEMAKQKDADKELSRQLQMAQLEEIKRKPQKEAEERSFKEREFGLKKQERLDTLEAKKAEKEQSAIEKKMKEMEEVNYRTNSINASLDKLEDIVKKYGTFEAFGPQSEQMEQEIYNASLDYAKLVDPASVAREGEVAAAKKYALPIKGLGISNASALKLIQDMRSKANQRAAQIQQSKGLGELVKGQAKPGLNELVQSKPAPQANKVKVSNGKETLMIDPSDIEAAAKDGYLVVK